MKSVAVTFSAIVLICGISYGQEKPGPNFEHLKAHRPIIGTWRYEGPLLEDVPSFAEKGSNYIDQISWRWILNKNAVEITWRNGFENGKQISGKGLIWWDAAERRIAATTLDSTGGVGHGTIVMKDGGRYSTLTSTGINEDGQTTTFVGVLEKLDSDTLTWHAAERTGGSVNGPSPKYTFTRVKRADRAQQSAEPAR